MKLFTLILVVLATVVVSAQDSTDTSDKYSLVVTMTKINGRTVMGTTKSDLTAIHTTQALIRDMNQKKNAGNVDEYDTKVSMLLKDLQRKGVRIYE